MSLTIGGRDNVAFATVNIVGSRNEDRACCLLSHDAATQLCSKRYKKEAGGGDEFISFGVFDGHNGAEAAHLAAENLHTGTVRSYAELLRVDEATKISRTQRDHEASFSSATSVTGVDKNEDSASTAEEWISLLEGEERKDALLCLALNETIDCIHHIAQSESGAGTTVASLFLRQIRVETEDVETSTKKPVGTRAVCANVGDSRCVLVMAQPVETEINTGSAHSNHSAVSSSRRYSGTNVNINGGDSQPVRSVSLPPLLSQYETKPQILVHSVSDSPQYGTNLLPADIAEAAINNEMAVNDEQRPSNGDDDSDGEDIGEEFLNGEVAEHLRHCMDTARKKVMAHIALYKMSEDHNMTCRRELRRIKARVPIEPMSLPIPATWQQSADYTAPVAEIGATVGSVAPSLIPRHVTKSLKDGIKSIPVASNHSLSSFSSESADSADISLERAIIRPGSATEAGKILNQTSKSSERDELRKCSVCRIRERRKCRTALKEKLRDPNVLPRVISVLCANPPLKPQNNDSMTPVQHDTGMVITAAVAESLSNPKKKKALADANISELDVVNKRNRDHGDQISALTSEDLANSSPQDLLLQATERVAATHQETDASHYSHRSSFVSQSVHISFNTGSRNSGLTNKDTGQPQSDDLLEKSRNDDQIFSVSAPQLIFDSTSYLLHQKSQPKNVEVSSILWSQVFTKQQMYFLIRLYAARALQRRMINLRNEYRSNRLPQLPMSSSAAAELSSLVDSSASQAMQKNAGTANLLKKTYKIQAVHEDSFIATRNSSDGTVRGPSAYFGRFNHSLLMTRSLGDRLGPRGCITTPDISAITIPTHQHARFVIASDGVWDVISSETVRQWALFYKHRTAQDFAVYIAFKTRRRRARLQMRPDDVTVTVVDVNPHCALFTKSNRTKPDFLYPVHAVSAAVMGTSKGSNTTSNKDSTTFSEGASAQFPWNSIHSVGSSNVTRDTTGIRVKPLAAYSHLLSAVNVPGKGSPAVLTSAAPVNTSIDNTYTGTEETIAHYTLKQPSSAPCTIM